MQSRYLLCAAWLPLAAWAAPLPPWAADIDAGTLAVIADGDFVAQTYATGRLAPVDAGWQDTLAVWTRRNGAWTHGRIPVSNSVTAAPEILALAPGGATAFVVERLGMRQGDAQTVRDLPAGSRLFAVDLGAPQAPRIAATLDVGPLPEALSVSADGRRVAVVANSPDDSLLTLARYEQGRFDGVQRFTLRELGVEVTSTAPRAGLTATNVHWHPSGRYLAVNLNTLNRVAFFQVDEAGDGALALRPWGEPVVVGTDPFVGRFTPDGRYYLAANWGRDFSATTLDGRVPARPSSISVIRLADGDGTRHAQVGRTQTDESSEGLAVSPDGGLVATVNMRGTPFPPDSPRFARQASVSLLTLDASTGNLSKVADYAFEGVLPEGATFDASGNYLLVTVFQYHAGGPAGGGLEVFRVVRDGTPALRHVGRLPMPHGTHHVAVAR
ncbi:beta-propeller fold lactonase family protein [Bordetella sp. BOR01]|uniref:lactonase family protein n=1 Tax=Bordetella sp. BOR01 TaxID=2854779 RepID=UPI001C4622B0|nr:beta-propeller fold lactonase family protein [Bordetella sp. BOR01]MBV7485396.1 lactonase family protein [Bordetella sp. BOR01]